MNIFSWNTVNAGLIVALLIFLGSYALIISEKIHRTVVALFGAALMVVSGVLMQFYNQEHAIESIDFNTIGLLVGMMVIVGVAKDTGIFQYVAIKSAKLAKGDPWKILVLFSIITFISSAILDNVTTVLLMVPMTLVVCDNLRIKPMPFLFAEIFMGNLGGAATLIGDTTSILIGSSAKLSFFDFLLNSFPIIAVIFVVVLLFIKVLFKKSMIAEEKYKNSIMRLNEKDTITNPKLVKKSLFVIALVVLGFFLHGFLGMEAATIAIFGAGLLLFIDNKNPEKALHEVEWTTIFFFVGLFVLVGGLEAVGIITWAAHKMVELTGGSMSKTMALILWGGAFFSAFIDNVPFVTTMIPMIHEMGAAFPDLNPLWWSLVLCASLGGNGTLVGASTNLVVAGMAEKSGFKICFLDFLKIGMIVLVMTVSIANVYLFLRYL